MPEGIMTSALSIIYAKWFGGPDATGVADGVQDWVSFRSARRRATHQVHKFYNRLLQSRVNFRNVISRLWNLLSKDKSRFDFDENFLRKMFSIRMPVRGFASCIFAESQIPQSTEEFLSSQVAFRHKRFCEIYSTVITNKLAAGYIYGAIVARERIQRSINPDFCALDRLFIREKYRRMFGDDAGTTLYISSLRWKRDRDFQVGRQSGYENYVDYCADGIPTFGLQHIVSLGFDASMVKRTLSRRPLSR